MECENYAKNLESGAVDFQSMSIDELQRFLESVNGENVEKENVINSLVQELKPQVIAEIIEATKEGEKLDNDLVKALALDVSGDDAKMQEGSEVSSFPDNSYTIIGMREEEYVQVVCDLYGNEYEAKETQNIICCTKAGKKYEIALFEENVQEIDNGFVSEIGNYDYTCDPRMQISEVDEFGTITYLPRRKLTVVIPQDDMDSFNGEFFQCEAFICGNSQSRAYYSFFAEKANSKSQEDLNSFSLEELRSNLVRTRVANNAKIIAIEEIEKQKQEEIERARRIEQERKKELIQAISSAQKKGKSLDKEIKSLRSDKEKMLGKNDANFTLNQILSTILSQNQSQQV